MGLPPQVLAPASTPMPHARSSATRSCLPPVLPPTCCHSSRAWLASVARRLIASGVLHSGSLRWRGTLRQRASEARRSSRSARRRKRSQRRRYPMSRCDGGVLSYTELWRLTTLLWLLWRVLVLWCQASYFEGLPFQPGQDALWRMAQACRGRGRWKPRLKVNVPDTLLVSNDQATWLHTNSKGVVALRSTSSKTWRAAFVKACLDASPFPDVDDPIVAVLKVTHTHQHGLWRDTLWLTLGSCLVHPSFRLPISRTPARAPLSSSHGAT